MAEDMKRDEPQGPAVKKPAPTATKTRIDDSPRWGLGSIFWGLLLITIGVLALLANFGVVSLNLLGLSQLWPLLLIVWGVSMLSIRGAAWRALMILLVIATLGFVTWVAVSGVNLQDRQSARSLTQTVGELRGSTKQLDLTVDAGAGRITLDSADMKDTVRATLESDVAELERKSEARGDTQFVTLKLKSESRWWFSGVKNELDIDLSRTAPTILTLKSGASDVNADFRNVLLDKLTLDLGAASADITLGDLRDDLRVVIDAGATSLDLNIPKDVGVRVDIEGGASSKEFEGLENKGDGVYESSNFATAAKKITISGEVGATAFTIDRY